MHKHGGPYSVPSYRLCFTPKQRVSDCLQVSAISDIDRAGHLPTVLSCLESFQDLVRCSAVSKAWKEASQRVQPVSLELQVDHWTSPSSANKVGLLESILQSLQLQQRKGRFCTLRHLHLSMYWPGAAPSGTMQLFMQSILTLAGSWELYSCYITGICSLYETTALLPSCLQHIALNSSIGDAECVRHVLDKMKRFPKLHTLQLAYTPKLYGPVGDIVLMSRSSILGKSTLPQI